MREVKLVICDIDWTLISRNKRVLSDYAKSKIEELHNRGILFGLASGRPIDEVQVVIDSWGLSFPCDVFICMNGSELWIEHNQVFQEFYKLKRQHIKEIVNILEPFDVNPYMYYHKGIKSLKLDDDIIAAGQRSGKKVYIAKDIEDFANEDNAKIMIRMEDDKMAEFEKYMKHIPMSDYQGFKTQQNLMEFADKRTSKGATLVEYCKISGLPIESVMAFGDTTNDNELLINAGWGVCLSNGSEDTKNICDDLTEYDVHNDGVAHYIDKHIFKN